MAECEDKDCGDESCRRVRCYHCGLLVCGWCWHHVHGCEPGHKRVDCKSLKAYNKFGAEWIKRLRARMAIVAAQGHQGDEAGHGMVITKMMLAAELEARSAPRH